MSSAEMSASGRLGESNALWWRPVQRLSAEPFTQSEERSMNDALRKLFGDFDNGRLTRRELMQALALLAVIAPVRAAIGQGGGVAPPTGRDTANGGRRGRAIAPQDTIPAPPPFEATGWKTVWLDHLTYRTTDYKKAAAFYATLMGWKIRSDDGKQ